MNQYLKGGKKLVILDSRPFEEYHRMNIPGGIDAPGAELAWRVHDLAPDPGTLVVVNCAGRTRSIIGCQSLRNAGIPNEVVALKDGTMGWELAGFECERGQTRVAPPPSEEGRKRARAMADGVAKRFQVKFTDRKTVEKWISDPSRTLYLLDVRSREEFEARRIAGSRHAPGGQLVQATDETIGVRNSRVVLVDPERPTPVTQDRVLYRCGWTPFEGEQFSSSIAATFSTRGVIDASIRSEAQIAYVSRIATMSTSIGRTKGSAKSAPAHRVAVSRVCARASSSRPAIPAGYGCCRSAEGRRPDPPVEPSAVDRTTRGWLRRVAAGAPDTR